MKFEIGEGATVKLDALLSTRLMAQANSGGGKSWLLRRLLEQTHGRVQQFVIDPEGEFATLRQKFDYVLAAKNGGDTLAEPRAAKLLAERLLKLRVSAILDIQELKPTERVEFVQLFLESLIDAPKSLWRPALVVIDEAHVFCPQGGEASSSIAVRDLCARGRKRGYCAVLATQRISKLHKDAVAECNNKLIGRASLDVDMKRCGDELGFAKDRWHELRKLKPGEFFAYGPAIEARPADGKRAVTGIVTRIHVGPVVTQHPKVGARRLRIKALPPPTRKIKKMLPASRRRNSLPSRSWPVTRMALAPPKRVEVQVIKPKTVRQLSQLVAAFDRSTRAFAGSITGVSRILGKADGIGETIAGAVASVTGGAVGRAVTHAARVNVNDTINAMVGNKKGTITNVKMTELALAKPERRLLDALAWFEAIGVKTPEQPAVAFMAGYTYGSGAYNNPRGQLKKKGLVEYHSNNQIGLTPNGRLSATYPPRHEMATASQLHTSVLARLPQPEQRLLKPLIEAWPHAMDQRELAAKAGYAFNSGAFNNPRGRLKSLGMIDYPDKGRIVARDLLFPNQRRK